VESDPDTLARVLAVAGLVTALFGTVIAVLAFLRDRSKVSVTGVKVSDEEEGRSYVEVTVINNGRQPVSVMAAGIRFQHPEVRARTGLTRIVHRAPREAGALYVSFFSNPHFFPPGVAQQFSMTETELPLLRSLGVTQATPFAEDSRGHLVTASSFSLGSSSDADGA